MKIETILKTVFGIIFCGFCIILCFSIAEQYQKDSIPLADRLHQQAATIDQTDLINSITFSAKYGEFEITVSEAPTPDQIKYLTNQKFTLEYLTLPDPNDLSKLDTLSTTIKW